MSWCALHRNDYSVSELKKAAIAKYSKIKEIRLEYLEFVEISVKDLSISLRIRNQKLFLKIFDRTQLEDSFSYECFDPENKQSNQIIFKKEFGDQYMSLNDGKIIVVFKVNRK